MKIVVEYDDDCGLTENEMIEHLSYIIKCGMINCGMTYKEMKECFPNIKDKFGITFKKVAERN